MPEWFVELVFLKLDQFAAAQVPHDERSKELRAFHPAIEFDNTRRDSD